MLHCHTAAMLMLALNALPSLLLLAAVFNAVYIWSLLTFARVFVLCCVCVCTHSFVPSFVHVFNLFQPFSLTATATATAVLHTTHQHTLLPSSFRKHSIHYAYLSIVHRYSWRPHQRSLTTRKLWRCLCKSTVLYESIIYDYGVWASTKVQYQLI